ncbi:hypothetical protein NG799_28650 [Laspinema sp. D1]|uniref:Uncharacterized protein n=1 Tax=Laspinema palackyanum D2a TaxID=2953684 RepID=A0ABT2N2J3_9CYAN|nr:hypothetical protein [Laspinema sp. D2a]
MEGINGWFNSGAIAAIASATGTGEGGFHQRAIAPTQPKQPQGNPNIR